MGNLQQKIITDSKKQIKQKRKKNDQQFAKKYDKTKKFVFPAKDKINMEKHFYFPKFQLNPDADMTWSFGKNPPQAALAVYPVICSRANFVKDTPFQMPQATIAKLAGLSLPTTKKGIDHLVSKTSLLNTRKVVEGSRHYYVYHIQLIRQYLMKNWKGAYFIFHTCIINSGVWAKLFPRAKVLYLAMRSVANFDNELYGFIEGEHLDGMDLDEFYHEEDFKNRKWDVCEKSVSALCREMNIEPSNRRLILKQLEYYRLVEKAGPVYKVYLKPRMRQFNPL